MIKILIIAYYFPPCSAIGSKRWSKMFNQLGLTEEIDVKILTANWNGNKKQKNVYSVGPIVDYIPPKSLFKKKSFFERLKHPSEYFRSIAYETVFGNWKNLAKKWIDQNLSLNFDIVITSFSPISSILVGNYAKKKFKSKLVIDLRDLISLQGQKIQIPIIHQIDKYLDRFLCRNADLIITIGNTTYKKAKTFYKKKTSIIYNTINTKIIKTPVIDIKKTIDIGYFGTIGYNRNPTKIVHILSNFLNKFKNYKINLHFASSDNPYDYISNLDKISPLLKIKYHGYLPKNKINILYKKCNIYLLLEDQYKNGNENLTGKLFDYMEKSKPIIASCNVKSDIIGVLNYTTCGMLVSTSNDFKIFLKRLNGKYFFSKKNKIKFFSTKEQTNLLVKLLNKL